MTLGTHELRLCGNAVSPQSEGFSRSFAQPSYRRHRELHITSIGAVFDVMGAHHRSCRRPGFPHNPQERWSDARGYFKGYLRDNWRIFDDFHAK
jgi:hypothetical protein